MATMTSLRNTFESLYWPAVLMTDLAEFLFPAPARRTARGILGWWERRRLPYNMIVGSAGLLSLGVAKLVAWLPPESHPMPVGFLPVIVVGVFANICYGFGPALEFGIERFGRGRILPVGPALFRMGLTFSVGLVMLPILVTGFEWIYRILRFIV